MRCTSLCYIEHDGCYLMLHRIKKAVDENKDKWIGIGGKFEEGESPEECALREIREETNLRPDNLSFRGIVTFVSDEWGTEYMHLFTASIEDVPSLPECDEGTLEWVKTSDVPSLPIWPGDKIFLDLLKKDIPFFSLKLVYRGNNLISAVLNGSPLPVSGF